MFSIVTIPKMADPCTQPGLGMLSPRSSKSTYKFWLPQNLIDSLLSTERLTDKIHS